MLCNYVITKFKLDCFVWYVSFTPVLLCFKPFLKLEQQFINNKIDALKSTDF
jgi:hypothetical protein